MPSRVFIRIEDDQQLSRIDEIAEQLRGSGLEVSDISPVVGQITGTVNDQRMEGVKRHAEALGLRCVPDAEEAVHRLPPPDAELQ